MDTINIQDATKYFAFKDGSLRDIYIYDTSLEDWDELIKMLKDLYPLDSDEPIPDSVKEIIPIVPVRGFLVRVYNFCKLPFLSIRNRFFRDRI